MIVLLLLGLAQQPTGAVQPVLEARRAAVRPVIDGVIDSLEWSGADTATGFLQFLPRRGEPASRPTVARILYDSTALYISAEVHDDRTPTAQRAYCLYRRALLGDLARVAARIVTAALATGIHPHRSRPP